MNQYEAVIGLEVHAQLLTQAKLFCWAPVNNSLAENEALDAVSAGLPGSLPVLNEQAVVLAVRAGLLCNCHIAELSRFARKNYFYPDLPKGYQISQFDEPICVGGWVEIPATETSSARKIRLQRIHLEEDAGQLMHIASNTLVNLNRAGVPLIEIVSEPDIRSPVEAKNYLKALHEKLVHAQVTDGNLEQGNFRCDVNVSVRKVGEQKLGIRSEIKNLNSFRFVEQAIEYEISRHIAVLDSGGTIQQETRSWDASQNKSFLMRTKEDAEDYRYFPDPDIPPLRLNQAWIEEVRQSMPEDLSEKKARLKKDWSLSDSELELLISEPLLLQYVNALVNEGVQAKLAVSWTLSDVLGECHHLGLSFADNPIPAGRMKDLLKLLEEDRLSRRMAKKVLIHWFAEPDSDILAYIDSQGLAQVGDDSELSVWVDKVWDAHPQQVAEWQAGKDKILPFLMGQVMKESKGRAKPQKVEALLKQKLKQSFA